MRLAIIGAGNVGGTLGRRFAELDHRVTFGVREGGTIKGGQPEGTTAALPADAARDAEVVILATPWRAVPEVLGEIMPLGSKVLLDCTNPVGPGLTLDVGTNQQSGAERLADLAAPARVVKIFNTTGFQNMADPVYQGAPTAMFYAGDDAEAKSIARTLAEQLGFEAVDAGSLVRARELEHLALLWISLSVSGHGRDIAFRLVRR